MLRKTVITLFAFALVGLCVFGAGALANDQVGVPQRISESSPCPATGCANGQCHGFDDVPEPDGTALMHCPETSCSSTECHAWDNLLGRYRQASDASMNLWILLPALLAIGLVALVSVSSRRVDRRVFPVGTDADDAVEATDDANATDAHAGDGERR